MSFVSGDETARHGRLALIIMLNSFSSSLLFIISPLVTALWEAGLKIALGFFPDRPSLKGSRG
jgi:hypothetical protein